jgi:hypothetical protein
MYPHFCITPVNLFPMCDACQIEKGEKIGNDTNLRFFIHPYFDVFVARQVVELCISEPYKSPTFDLRSVANLTLDQSELVASHLRELGIINRYSHFFREQYFRLIRLVQGMRNSNLNVQKTLLIFKNSMEQSSLNSWEHVFYSSVLSAIMYQPHQNFL